MGKYSMGFTIIIRPSILVVSDFLGGYIIHYIHKTLRQVTYNLPKKKERKKERKAHGLAHGGL